MKRSYCCLGMAFALLAVACVASATKRSGQSLDRAGELRIGDSIQPLLKVKRIHAIQEELEGCGYYAGEALPKGVAAMVWDGRVVRFDIDQYEFGSERKNKAGAGPFGIRIGDSEASVLKKLPRGVEIRQHKEGDSDDHYLTWHDRSRDLGVRAEAWDGIVNQVHWGRSDAVELVEGCS